jgi:SAM-dependent methyltransferase
VTPVAAGSNPVIHPNLVACDGVSCPIVDAMSLTDAADATAFTRWISDLERRHLCDLTLSEVARALRALSSTYVERRARLSGRGAFDTAGKRAAYALYYAPRRFLTVAHVLERLGASRMPMRIVDLGCGTGAAGAAWAVHAGTVTSVLGVDLHAWAIDETRATYRAFGLNGDTHRVSVTAAARAGREGRTRGEAARPAGIVLSYVANELDADARAALLTTLLGSAHQGAQVLVMEPLSRRTSPWWNGWVDAFVAAGGRADEWRVAIAPPQVTSALGRATGLAAQDATGRTLWIG